MRKTNNAKKTADVPTLAEVAPSSSGQRLSEDLVAASLVRKGPAKNSASHQGVAFEQVRDLLMGETIQSLRNDLNTSHRIILQRVDALGTSASNQLETLEGKVASLSSDVPTDVIKRKAFAETHRQSMEISAAELKRELAEIKQSAERSMSKLKEDFKQQANFQVKAIENFEQTMGSKLEERGKNIGEATVAKEQLATILFDAAASFADPESGAGAAKG